MLCQPVHTHRDPGGKPSGVRVYYPPLGLPQSTLDDLGCNRGEPSPTLWAMWLQLVPTQGCQELLTPEMMCMWQQPDMALPSVTPNTMHTGTYQKVQ